jgi:flagellin
LSSTRAFENTALNFSTTGAATGTYGGDAAIEARAETVTFSTTAGVNEGDGYRVTIGSQNYDYVAGKGETFEDVARGLKTAIDAAGNADISTQVTQDATTGAWSLSVDNDGASLAFAAAGRSDGEASGGLFGLDSIDVTTSDRASAALANVETMIDNAISAASAFGSAQGRIETQADFVSKLTDSLTSGIGSLVDANMEETSARLQALQVQQQLATQSLSIANQAPQSILSLFR